MPGTSFTRMTSTRVNFQAHVSDDSRYVLVPVMEAATRISGWLVYDVVAGELLDDDGKPFTEHYAAREWVEHNRYQDGAA